MFIVVITRNLYSPTKKAQILYLNIQHHEQLKSRILIYGSTLFHYISARQKKTTIFIFSMLIFQREIIKLFALPEAGFDANFCSDIVS